jgi:hypothetical protein
MSSATPARANFSHPAKSQTVRTGSSWPKMEEKPNPLAAVPLGLNNNG